MSGSWWTEANATQEPRVRWLGVFPRPVRLRTDLARGVAVPSPRASAPERLTVRDAESTSEPLCLTAQWWCQPATSLDTSVRLAISDPAGSVVLARRLSEDEPSPSRRLTPNGQPTVQGSESPVPGAQIPLWKRLAYVLQPPTDLLLSELGPIEWPGVLFGYQIEGIRELLARDALLLADDMGLGKTIQAIAALRILALQSRVECSLLVVPASLVGQWRKALHLWAPELRISTIRGSGGERAWQWAAPAHVYLTSYETLREDFTENPQSPPRRRIWDAVILDEAQRIKNPEADVSRKCQRLRRRRSWALTGTPLENSLDDLASILEFVSPMGDGELPQRLFPGPALLDKHKALQLRRRKIDVLPQLPPKVVSQIVLPLTGPQRESYDRAERDGVFQLRERGESVRIENVLELIMRLKQTCNFCPSSGQSAKLDDLSQRLATLESEGHRALVFSQFTDEKHGARAIAAQLEMYQPLLYTGDVSPQQREEIIREFKQNQARKVLVLSLRAGGQGLNLQEASYVFHFDRWWNPAVEHQAEDRSHRLGQSSPVHVYKYVCEETIEERIDEILRSKQLLFDELVDDVTIDLRSALTSEELFGLFGMIPPQGAKTSPGNARAVPEFATMSGPEFEQYVGGLLQRKGWHVESTPLSRDGGVDLIARRFDDVGAESVLYIQCKNQSNPVGVPVVRELNGALPSLQTGVRGVVVCPSGFTADARAFARIRGLVLWDRHGLFQLAES